jgi:hypothetical protein
LKPSMKSSISASLILLGRLGVHHHGSLEVGYGAWQWRKLSPSADLMVDPGRSTRCAIRDGRAASRSLPLDRYSVRRDWCGGGEVHWGACGGAIAGRGRGASPPHSLTLCLFCRRIETQCPILREGAAEDGRVTPSTPLPLWLDRARSSSPSQPQSYSPAVNEMSAAGPGLILRLEARRSARPHHRYKV